MGRNGACEDAEYSGGTYYMKIAVTGKGGVGKSTFVALMAVILRQHGKDVLAIDADPDMNLGGILGVPDDELPTPIIDLKELIAERTGTEVGKSAPFFKMNPKVSDIPEKYWVNHGGIKLLAMGTVRLGGGGCACPLNAFLKQLLGHLVIQRDEWVLLDMEAGIEHLGRGTAVGVDTMIVVTEPNRSSLETAERIRDLAADLGIRRLAAIGNKVTDELDREYLEEGLKGYDVLGYLGTSAEIRKINLRKITAAEVSGTIRTEVEQIVRALEE